jgi:hypothetical protein
MNDITIETAVGGLSIYGREIQVVSRVFFLELFGLAEGISLGIFGMFFSNS